MMAEALLPPRAFADQIETFGRRANAPVCLLEQPLFDQVDST
jgi:hypothetical protein